MGNPTAEKVAQRAFDLGLLNERQLQEIWASLGSHKSRSTICCNISSAAST